MSREGSPARDVAARAGSSKEGSSKEGSAAITGDQFAQLMEEVRRLREGQEDAALKLEKGVRRDPYVFKRRVNENQFRFCEEIADRLSSASSSVVRAERGGGKAAFDRAKEALREDVFSSGVWPLLSNLEDPELRRLAKALPATVLECKADSTTKKYLGAFQRWKTWAEARRGVPSFPVQEIHLVLYLQHLSESIQSKSAVEEAVHAVSWLHQMAGLPSIAGSPIVQATLGGLRRELAKPKQRKEPVTAEMLLAMVEAAGPSPSLTEVRLLAICLVAFAGFLRCEELLKLRCADVAFNPEGMVIQITFSKTDQYREGASLVIACTGTPTCPVSMMQRYFSMGQLVHDSQDYLFRGIMHTKSGECLRKGGGLSYSRLRKLLLEKISSLGMDPKLFGMHSLRAGGATAAANAGVPDRLFKRHGRWKSESAKDGYVKDSVESRLEVSKNLGI